MASSARSVKLIEPAVLVRVLTTALVGLTVFMFAWFGISWLVANMAFLGHCGESNRRCDAVAIPLGQFVGVLLSTIAGWALLRRRTRYALIVAAFSTLSFDAFWWYLVGGYSLPIHPMVLAPFIMLTVYGLTYVYWTSVRAPLLMKVALNVLILGAIVILLPPFEQTLKQVVFRGDDSKLAKQLDFQIYAPTNVPSSYRLNTAKPLAANSRYRAMYQLHYQRGRTDLSHPLNFTITETRLDSTDYNPPSNCGSEVGGLVDSTALQHCSPVGLMSDGTPIYYAEPRVTGGRAFYAVLGVTKVSISTDLGHRPTDTQMIALLKSIEPKTLDELNKLQIVNN